MLTGSHGVGVKDRHKDRENETKKGYTKKKGQNIVVNEFHSALVYGFAYPEVSDPDPVPIAAVRQQNIFYLFQIPLVSKKCKK
jgi:hypothetical protein